MYQKFYPVLFLVLIASVTVKAQNCDPWIVKAYQQLYQRNPSTQECNIKNYNNGSWGSYDELTGYIKAYNSKKSGNTSTGQLQGDPWIFQAYNELYSRQPNAWELNVNNYNNGSWNNYEELKKYIQEFQAGLQKQGMVIKTAIINQNSALVSFAVNGKAIAVDLVSTNGGKVVAAGGANIVAAGGGNIVAAGGGNIVAAGGGNIVAAGGGNIIASTNMAGVTFGSRYTLQSEGTRIVTTSGKGALIIR